ncbi:hypothetical protein GCK32_016707, partial [Trichostrongylus colubriformis]
VNLISLEHLLSIFISEKSGHPHQSQQKNTRQFVSSCTNKGCHQSIIDFCFQVPVSPS